MKKVLPHSRDKVSNEDKGSILGKSLANLLGKSAGDAPEVTEFKRKFSDSASPFRILSDPFRPFAEKIIDDMLTRMACKTSTNEKKVLLEDFICRLRITLDMINILVPRTGHTHSALNNQLPIAKDEVVDEIIVHVTETMCTDDAEEEKNGPPRAVGKLTNSPYVTLLYLRASELLIDILNRLSCDRY